MKITEARIGNFVRHHSDPAPVLLTVDRFHEWLHAYGEDDHYLPVEISSEWLKDNEWKEVVEKADWSEEEGDEDCISYEKNFNDEELTIYQTDTPGEWTLHFSFFGETTVKHIHELQNICLSIFGKDASSQDIDSLVLPTGL